MKPMPGYIMVDATGLNVSDTEAQTVTGLHDRLEAARNTGKQILLTGVVNGDAVYSPASVICSSSANVTLIMSGFSATVDSDDEVTPVSD